MRPLSPRETEVLSLAARGKTNRAIAAELGIGVDSVKHHLRGCYLKLGVRTREEAAKRLRRGDLTPMPHAHDRLHVERPEGIDPEAWYRLPAAERRSLALKSRGLSHADVALLLGVRPDTVKKQARLAARKLRG